MIVNASSLGTVAGRLVDSGDAIKVIAVFERSFYLQAGDHYACVLPASAGEGALHICVDDEHANRWRLDDLDPGVRVDNDRLLLRVGNGLDIALRQARRWSPSDSLVKTDQVHDAAARLASGFTALSQNSHSEVDGLLCLFNAAVEESSLGASVLDAARVGVDALDRWLHAQWRGDRVAVPDNVLKLVGLGPGLTPSGDDCLGGVMIALHEFGQRGIAERLAERVLPSLADTVPISAAYVRAAIEGIGSARLHTLFDSAVAHDVSQSALVAAIQDAGRVGHTSGWDALAGVRLVCDVGLSY